MCKVELSKPDLAALIAALHERNIRIFCHKFEAELLGIGGRYKAADQIEPHLHGRPVQAWLDRSAIIMAVLDAYEDSSEPRQLRRVTGWPRFWS